MDTHAETHPFLHLPSLPVSARAMVERLLAKPLCPVADLAEMVTRYRAVIKDAAAAGYLRADVRLGLAIADVLTRVLGDVDERTEDEELVVVQVAVLFFVIEHDGYGHDLEHEDGLFADARVVNAMLRWIGREDLALPLPVPAAERRPVAVASPARSECA